MTPNRSRLLIAFLLGAGALFAGHSVSLAGDKIAFSWSTDKALALPPVIHPEDTAEALTFGHSSVNPVVDMDFIPEVVSVAPSTRSKKQNGLGAKSGSILRDRQDDESLGNPYERDSNDGDGASTGTNQNSYSMQKGWDSSSPQDLKDLGLGYDSSAARQDPAYSYEKHDRQKASPFGNSSENRLLGQSESAFSTSLGSQKQSISDIFQQQTRYGSAPDAFKQGQDSDPLDTSAGQTDTTISSIAAKEPDRNNAPSPSSGNMFSVEDGRDRQMMGQGLQDSLPTVRAWDPPSSRDPISADQDASRQKYIHQSQSQSPARTHPTTLPFPKNPGAF